jgi:hypothetical protein
MDRVSALIDAFSTSKRSDLDSAWLLADSMGDDQLCLLAKAFPKVRRWQGRASIMRFAGRFARTSDPAFHLGLAALKDPSYDVRHYACALLAYSLSPDSLPSLQALLKHRDLRTVEDAKAAIDAIRNKNHNYFKDRGHTGKILWSYASV